MRLLFLGMVLLFGSGCGGNDDLAELVAVTPTSQPPTRRPTITPMPTNTRMPTATATIPVPTTPPTLTPTPMTADEFVEFQSIRIFYPAVLVRNVSPRFNQAQGNMIPFARANAATQIYDGVPDLLVFDFVLFDRASRRGQLTVIEVADESGTLYPSFNNEESDAIRALQLRLSQQNNRSVRSNQIPEAFIDYISLRQGTALRSIQYLPTGSELTPVGQNNLFYVAEGFLDDRYYFEFKFPITVPDHPNGIDFDENTLVVKNEIDLVLAELERNNTAFAPTLRLMDEVVGSLRTLNNRETGPVVSGTTVTPAATPTIASLQTGQTATPSLTPTAEPTLAPTATNTPRPTRTPRATATAPAAPTNTPRPTATRQAPSGPVPTNVPSCSHFLIFVSDVTVPDGTAFPPGSTFTKTWRVENQGSCHLSSRYTLFPLQETIEVIEIEPLPVILAGDQGDISIELRAPQQPGRYVMNFQVVPPTDGSVTFQEPFGQLYVEIVVDPAAPSPTPVASGSSETAGGADLAGTWAIDRFVRTSGAALSNSQAAQQVTQEVVITSSSVRFDGERCSGLTFDQTPTTAGDYLTEQFGVRPSTLGLSSSSALVAVESSCDIEGFDAFFLVEGSPAELVLAQQGVFFFLRPAG